MRALPSQEVVFISILIKQLNLHIMSRVVVHQGLNVQTVSLHRLYVKIRCDAAVLVLSSPQGVTYCSAHVVHVLSFKNEAGLLLIWSRNGTTWNAPQLTAFST